MRVGAKASGLQDAVVARRRVLSGALAMDALQFCCVRTGVDVWCLRVGDLPASAVQDAAGAGLLSAAELARHGRFRFQRDRDAYLAKRLLVRGALSEYAEVAPEAWRFAEDAQGRPRLAPEWDAAGLAFNLSRAGELAVCGVARGRVMGVDVEDLGRVEAVDASEWVLAVEERERLGMLPEAQRRTAFLRYWTLKEAYVKARGLGLSLPVAEVCFDYDRPGGITVRLGGSLLDVGARWRFEQVRVLERYVVAVASGGVEVF